MPLSPLESCVHTLPTRSPCPVESAVPLSSLACLGQTLVTIPVPAFVDGLDLVGLLGFLTLPSLFLTTFTLGSVLTYGLEATAFDSQGHLFSLPSKPSFHFGES